jgi:hypothetical protein
VDFTESRGVVVLTACLWTLAAPAALAGELPDGTVELSTQMMFAGTSYSVNGDHTFSTTELNLQGSVGYCFTEAIEVEGAIIFTHQSVDEEGEPEIDGSSFGLGAAVIRNFSTDGSVVPFLRAGFALLDHSGQAYGPETSLVVPTLGGGLRFLVTGSAAITTGLFYQHITDAFGDDDLSANQVFLAAGISLLFLP